MTLTSPPRGIVRIVGREPTRGDLTLVRLAPPEDMRVFYTRPGQVVIAHVGGESSYFAMAARVGDAHWELLVRDTGTVARAILEAPLGSELAMTAPSFAGFPYLAGEPGPFTLVAVGSALGAVRGVYLALEDEGRARELTLVLGVRDVSFLPLEDELRRLAEAGARVVVCLSDVSEAVAIAPLEVRIGLVQAALVEQAAARVAAHGGELFVAGPSSLMDELRSRAEELRHRVHVNA